MDKSLTRSLSTDAVRYASVGIYRKTPLLPAAGSVVVQHVHSKPVFAAHTTPLGYGHSPNNT